MKTLYNNKLILRNTLYLYLRMIVTMIVSLYTTRLTLQLLGVENFGIFNVIGGVIGFMGFFTATMGSATQRYLSFDLGTNNIAQFRKTFSMFLNIYAIFCFVAMIVLEVAGPYLISEYLNIPSERKAAAQWIYQFTVISFMAGSILVPYTSAIVAYEKIAVYAYLTFLDVVFKLVVVFSLYVTPYDKLVTYGLLTCIMTVTCNLIYYIYCKLRLDGCRYIKFWDKKLFKEIASYAGWNLFGATSSILINQGLTILLNLFFGPIVNAAKAIADKINQTVTAFCANFYMAVNPQIIKTYASEDICNMRKLIIWSSKLSFYLLCILSIPLICNMEFLLELWLGTEQVSKEMIAFSQWILVYSLVNILENPITQAVRATGKIKRYQIVVGIQTLIFIPICYLCFKLGMPAYGSMVVLSALYFIVQFSRIGIVLPIIKLSIAEYCKCVLVPVVLTSIISYLLVNAIHQFLIFDNGYAQLLSRLALDVILIFVVITGLGVNHNEKVCIKQLIVEYFNRKLYN